MAVISPPSSLGDTSTHRQTVDNLGRKPRHPRQIGFRSALPQMELYSLQLSTEGAYTSQLTTVMLGHKRRLLRIIGML